MKRWRRDIESTETLSSPLSPLQRAEREKKICALPPPKVVLVVIPVTLTSLSSPPIHILSQRRLRLRGRREREEKRESVHVS